MESRDAQDWTALIAGDREALARLYSAHATNLLRYGRGLADDQAVADALHTLFLRLWERRERLPSDAHPRAYLLIALRNELLRSLRTEKRTGSLSEDGSTQPDDGEDSVEFRITLAEHSAEQQQHLARALAALSPRERELVSLRFLQELDYDRIAEVTGISYQSARNVLARALTKLRAHMSIIFWCVLGTATGLTTLLHETPLPWLP